jgi:protein AaeX
MRFNEINLFGLYVAPIAVILVIAWVIYLLLRRAGDRIGLTEQVWHPALFELALYVMIVSSIVLVMARWGR